MVSAVKEIAQIKEIGIIQNNRKKKSILRNKVFDIILFHLIL